MKSIKVWLWIMVVLMGGLATTFGQGTWSSLSPVPSVGAGVEGASAGVIGSEIIMACGLDSGLGDTAFTRIYDIPSDSWSYGANAPGVTSEGGTATHGGLLYVIGGRGPGANANWAYNPVTDTWTVLAALPTARAGVAVAQVGNAIYAIGGRTGTGGPNAPGKLAVVERYDIDTDSWTTVAPLPYARSDAAAAVVGGKIYVFGGFNAAGTTLSNVAVYDPNKNQWNGTSQAPMPTPRGSFYAVTRNGGTVYVIGGYVGPNCAGQQRNVVEAYKVSQNSWTTGLPAMPTPRSEAGAAARGDRIYILGGGACGISVNANEAYKVNP
jgi:large repetitive protein